MRAGLKVLKDRTKEVADAIGGLAGTRTLVGWPESSAGRDDVLNNPTLGYIHHHGAPEANIPARPALSIGIAKAQKRINNRLEKAGKAALDGKKGASLAQMQMMGQEAADAVRSAITDGIPPPLSDRTLQGRMRSRKSGRKEAAAEWAARAGGKAPGVALAKPLLHSGQLARAVSYVVDVAQKGESGGKRGRT